METLVRMGESKVEFEKICIAICIYITIALLSFIKFRNATVGMIEETGTNTRYYPKHYISPKRWMRKLFHIKDRVIPRYLYLELYFSLSFLILGPINIVIFIAVGFDQSIGGILLMFHCCLIFISTIIFIIMSLIYKKGKK